jgi:hypothetical protein
MADKTQKTGGIDQDNLEGLSSEELRCAIEDATRGATAPTPKGTAETETREFTSTNRRMSIRPSTDVQKAATLRFVIVREKHIASKPLARGIEDHSVL